MHLIRLLIFTACSNVAFGQTALDEMKRQVYGNPFGAANENWVNMTNAMFDDNQISLLLLDSWETLEVEGADGELIMIDSANYHIEADKILFVYQGAMFELYPERVASALLDSTRFVSMTFDNDKELTRGYFEVLAQGDMWLYRRWSIDRVVTNSSPLGLPAAREERYELSEDLYYRLDSSSRPRELPKKRSDFIKIFRRDRSKMVDYAKRNGLNPKRNEDVLMLIAYYNSLDE